MESAIVAKSATTQMSPLEAYMLGYDSKDAVPALKTTQSGSTVTFGFDGESGARTISGLSMSYKLHVSDDDPTCQSAVGAIDGTTLTINAFTKKYTRLVATIEAASSSVE